MSKKSLIYIAFAGIAWGTACLFVKSLTTIGLSSMQIAASRSISGAVSAFAAMTVINAKNLKSIKITSSQLVIFMLQGVTFFAMAALYYMAIGESSPSTASVLLYTAPVVVVGFSAVVWKEKLTLKKITAIIGSVAGCVLVTGALTGIKFSFLGVLFGLMSSATYAAYTLLTKLALKKGADPIVATTWSFVFSAVTSMFFVNPASLAEKALLMPSALIPMIGIGVVTGSFASFAYMVSMRKLPAGTVASLATIEPLTSTVMSVVFLGEVLSVSSALGIAFILASVTLLSFDI